MRGYIVIERTEALTVIDVNTGKYVGVNNLEDTVLRTNLDAVKEIGKQLRLRDIGGIIIIDLSTCMIRNIKTGAGSFKAGIEKDRTKTTVVGMTGLGLIEMTRKKVREGLESMMLQDCPYCEGRGKILSPSLWQEMLRKR